MAAGATAGTLRTFPHFGHLQVCPIAEESTVMDWPQKQSNFISVIFTQTNFGQLTRTRKIGQGVGTKKKTPLGMNELFNRMKVL